MRLLSILGLRVLGRFLSCGAVLFILSSCAEVPRKELEKGTAERPLWIKKSTEGFFGDHVVFIDFRSADGIPVTTYMNAARKVRITGESKTVKGLRELCPTGEPVAIPGSYKHMYDVGVVTYTYCYKDSEKTISMDLKQSYKVTASMGKLIDLFNKQEEEIAKRFDSESLQPRISWQRLRYIADHIQDSPDVIP